MPHKRPTKNGRAKQCAALPFTGEPGATKVLLVTSRGTGRWVLPKGWVERGLKGHELAAKEAFEEAGVVGQARKHAIGAYSYDKDGVEMAVRVFALKVEKLLDDWPEQTQRTRRWFSLAEAATVVDEGELVVLLLQLSAEDIGAG